jgi:uncharacterized protein (DUF1330 family)
MKATIIVEGIFQPNYERYFVEYSAKVRAYLSMHDGVVVRRQRVTKMLYGKQRPDLVMVIDFADHKVAEQIFFAPEYLDIIPLCDKIFSQFSMYLADFGDV